ncbi:MAG: AarF/ABC1/UbiB kinase family protein [Deltaproteobacteria bacterium]|nr:AarF/ABC1/UbiB kinase family protein [Deltaproteobacteria bacterium]
MRHDHHFIGMNGISRFVGITRVLVKNGFGTLADALTKRTPAPQKDGTKRPSAVFPSPRRLRRMLTELGPSFVKLGQLMSVRADIFPPEYIDELTKLQDQVPPQPFKSIQPFLEKELGQPLLSVFKEFDETPIASASIAQVYKAQLLTGEPVAVKVVRPGISKQIRRDIRVMYYMAHKLEKMSELARVVGAKNVVEEFERSIYNELDMHIEAGSIEKFFRFYRHIEEIYIPKVYWEQTAKSVLVIDFIPGVKMNQVPAIREMGIDPKEIAMIGLRSLSRQLMEFGFVHADPHPGNTIVMPDGRVGLVDFGITAHLDEELMIQIARLFLGYAEHDYNLVMESLLDAGIIDEDMDLSVFRNDLKEMSEPFYGRSLQTISVVDIYDQVIRLLFRYHIRLPQNLLLLLKTFIQTESLGKILGSDASILEVIRPYARAMLERGYDSKKILRAMGRDAWSTGRFLRHTPKLLYDILKQAAMGKQRLQFHHSGFEDVGRRFERGLNRLVIAIVIAASITAGAHVLDVSEKIVIFPMNIMGTRSVSLTALLGLLGYTIASILGIWLIVSIFRSGRK